MRGFQRFGVLGMCLSLALAASTRSAQAGLVLNFAINPSTQPLAGSFEKDANSHIVGTNLAVTSATSASTGQEVQMNKYLDFQTKGNAAPNIFILDGLVQRFGGSDPTTYASPASDAVIAATGKGTYTLTMMINNGYVSECLADKFGAEGMGGFGWVGTLVLNLSSLDCNMPSAVTSGSMTLSAPSNLGKPAPAGGVVPNAVPEPMSMAMTGCGLLLALGGAKWTRSRRQAA